MKSSVIVLLTAAFLSFGCDKDKEKDKDDVTSYPSIKTESEAKELAKAVRKTLETVDKSVTTDFSSPVTINGSVSGTVIVRGEKTHTYLPTTNYTADDSNFTSLEFSSFSNSSNLEIKSGSGTFYYHYDYASRGGASSTHINVSYKLSSCKFIFSNGANQYGGTVTIDYKTSSGTKGRGYNASVTIGESGESFSIAGFD